MGRGDKSVAFTYKRAQFRLTLPQKRGRGSGSLPFWTIFVWPKMFVFNLGRFICADFVSVSIWTIAYMLPWSYKFVLYVENGHRLVIYLFLINYLFSVFNFILLLLIV